MVVYGFVSNARKSSQKLGISWKKNLHLNPMKLSRIEEVDLAYCGFWIVFMGGFLAAILWMMVRIERNTR